MKQVQHVRHVHVGLMDVSQVSNLLSVLDEVMNALVFAGVERNDDVVVGQPCSGLDFAMEPQGGEAPS